MSRRFSSLRARAISHATEDVAKVELALRAVVGDAEVVGRRTEGHHGNPIITLESVLRDEEDVVSVFARMSEPDLADVKANVTDRLDRSCRLFLRFDKQEAYAGRLVLVAHDDVVAVRVKVQAFPARQEVAAEVVRGFIVGGPSPEGPGRPHAEDV